MSEVILLDGKMVAYRAHYSHSALKNRDGDATGILHGFLVELLSINKKLPEARIVICWDGKGKTWRHIAYPAYKAQRPFNPDWKKMNAQIEELLPLLEKLGFHVYRFDGVEADDLIGILATQLNQEEIRIYSADKDMYQLVKEGVYVWPKFDKALVKVKDVERWLQAPIEALAAIKAMAGDPADNLKGLPGVGFVTARKIWHAGHRLTDASNGKLWDKYRAHWVRLRKEYQLAQIIRSEDDDVWDEQQREQLKAMVRAVDKSPERNQRKGMQNKQEFYEFLGRYELKDLFAERHRLLSLP
jgi:5'-3' exonuclease